MKKILILVTLLFSSLFAFGQNSPEEIIEKFFNTFEKDGISKGIEYLFSTNVWMKNKADDITKLKTQSETYLSEDLVGKYFGYELITKKSVGKSYVYTSYMVKYDRQPYRFEFVMYKPDRKWKVQNFAFDDSLDDELEEAGKMYRLPENY